MNQLLRTGYLVLLTSSLMSLPTPSKAQQKEFYNFKMKETPSAIPDYAGIAIYSVSDSKVYTLRNSVMADLGEPINWMAFNPTGFNFVIVGQGKKHGEARVIVTNEFNRARYKHNVKRHGSPTSAIFTPDARALIVAADGSINIFETKKFEPVDTFPAQIKAKEMTMSGNGYFLALTDGSKVMVYNYADKRLRKQWKFDVPVTQMAFSPDDSEFAVLTSDGLMSIYNTRDFIIKKNIDGLGEGIDFDYNPDGKYVAVATSPKQIAIVNTLDDADREHIDIPEGAVSDVKFLTDATNSVLIAYNTVNAVNAKRLTKLLPHYARLISDQADEMMNEWLKMMPGETMEQYRERVSEANRAKQRRMFEDEISTGLAGDLVSMSKISLGKYDRSNQVLAVEFDNMPSILLPVPEKSVGAFANVENISVQDAKYGIMPNDNFELIYAKFHNNANGETYIYDNLDRVPLAFMDNDDNVVSLEVLQQQQMEELKLQELREKVVAEAKSRNVISDHTNIAVDSRVVPDYDADGKKILNYIVRFSYEVEPDYSIHEDFGPGKYKVEESGAASSMLSIIKQAFEGDLAQYVAEGKKLRVNISGAADGTPIRRIIPYDGCYGDFEEEPVVKDGIMTAITVTGKGGITQNEQLAFLRGYGVKDFLQSNVKNLDKMNADYRYNIAVSEDKGSEFRRIVAELTFVDVF
ncbi:MAG: WD40 repeat domain-containing protein [Muribaculaceae bacterium]|nr:WD40 repeat domain-containing protein [Muribaculaceae bacterium]